MLLLYLKPSWLVIFRKNIYIPLCFYFIIFWSYCPFIRISNLHSTMLLLYPHWGAGTPGRGSRFTFHYASTLSSLLIDQEVKKYIYIPLCFYFIDQQRTTTDRICFIYIPLCFYFIYNIKEFRTSVFAFTFHYASTLSHHRPSMNDFVHTHLHSTMLLLYPLFFMTAYYTGEIYIPLCFYFIESLRDVAAYPVQIYIPLCFYFIVDNPEDKRRNYNGFTFHYASTLSRIWSKRTGKSFIYIPLCFYFIAVLHN